MSDLSTAILALSPDRYYPLGTDSSGTMTDATGGGNGTWTDQPTFGQSPILGGASDCAAFSGSGDRGTFSLSLGSGVDWTVHVVAQGTGGAAHPNRDFAWSTQYSGDRLAFLARDNANMYGYVGAGSSGDQAAIAKDSDPHQWVLEFHPHASTGYLRLWQDGVMVAQDTGAMTWVVPSTHYVGADYTSSGQPWVGSLSDLALWVGAVPSSDDIGDLWVAAQGTPEPANARVTQLVRAAVLGDVADARVTQLVRAAVLGDTSDARVTQLVRAVVIESDVPASARVTQLVRNVVVEHIPPADQSTEIGWSG